MKRISTLLPGLLCCLMTAASLIPQEAKAKATTTTTTTTAAASATTSFTSSYTYTYLRCFYRLDNALSKPKTTYVWGRDPSSGDYFRIYGYWWKDGLLNWQNMFYSDVTQDKLQSVCRSTLASRGIDRPVAMYAAADHSLSLNYTVWSNDNALQGNKINKIVVFGDSLSDTQNLFNAAQWQLPNQNSWFLGRFSNSKVWIEYLSESLKLPHYNWAVAGAAADAYLVIPGVVQQVDSWAAYMQRAPDYRPENTLFTILVGGNDMINYGRNADSIIASERQALEKLILKGAKNILLLNLPDVSRTPQVTKQSNRGWVAEQIVIYNQRLAQLRDELQSRYGSSLVIRVFDTYSLFGEMLNNPAKYGITNTTWSCLNISGGGLNYLHAQTLRPECTNPDTFVFWDELHPTTRTHKLLADQATGFVKSNFPALPGTFNISNIFKFFRELSQ